MSKWKKLLFATDLHGDRQHAPTVKRLLQFADEFKPDHVVFGGDAFDFRALRKGASKEETAESMEKDIDAGLLFLNKFFRRKAETKHFLLGNHSHRLWETAECSSGIIKDYAQEGVQKITSKINALGAKILPYHKRDGILRIGHLKMLHGFYCGVYAARQHAMTYGSCLFGHVHIIDEHPVPGLERRVARAVGCLCELDMDYNNRNPGTLRQAHGWAYGVINDRTGEYFINQAEEINGQWNVDYL
jgi:hypothetical protein